MRQYIGIITERVINYAEGDYQHVFPRRMSVSNGYGYHACPFYSQQGCKAVINNGSRGIQCGTIRI